MLYLLVESDTRSTYIRNSEFLFGNLFADLLMIHTGTNLSAVNAGHFRSE